MRKLLLIASLAIFATACGNKSVEFSKSADGNPGVEVGPKGDKGDKGETGVPGETGPAGAKGDKGDKGLNGAAGPKGDTGAKGATGPAGAKGDKGDKGERGFTGATGKTGDKGEKGDKGDTGAKGDSGASLIMHKIPVRGDCVDIGGDLYAENEGGHADIYNNDRCDHGPDPLMVHCNDLEAKYGNSRVCWVGTRQFSIQGRYSDMIVFELNFTTTR